MSTYHVSVCEKPRAKCQTCDQVIEEVGAASSRIRSREAGAASSQIGAARRALRGAADAVLKEREGGKQPAGWEGLESFPLVAEAASHLQPSSTLTHLVPQGTLRFAPAALTFCMILVSV